MDYCYDCFDGTHWLNPGVHAELSECYDSDFNLKYHRDNFWNLSDQDYFEVTADNGDQMSIPTEDLVETLFQTYTLSELVMAVPVPRCPVCGGEPEEINLAEQGFSRCYACYCKKCMPGYPPTHYNKWVARVNWYCWCSEQKGKLNERSS